ncbi:hypothetical protein C4572_00945 [Candidatus Parcubacteria bacterium]|nr:MAG: hypothetical protein C4572_00945 [Candidatus Parcubacteria bacterium]
MKQISKIRLIMISLLLASAVFLITFRFAETPKVWIDEGIFTETAKNLAVKGNSGIQINPQKIISSAAWSTAGYPLIFPVAASFKIFGVGLMEARLPMLIYLMGLVVAFYVFSFRVAGFYAGVSSVLLLLSFSPFYGNGRPVQGEIPGLVFFIFASVFLFNWEKRDFKKTALLFWSGLFFGLAASSKPLYLMLILPTLLLISILIKKKGGYFKNLIFFGGGFIIPLVLWFFTQFPNFSLFQKALRIYFTANPDASVSSTDSILSNIPKFFSESTPMLFMAMLFPAVIFYSIKVIKRKKYTIAEVAILIFIILNLFAFLKGPGWYRHFFPGHILLYLIIPVILIESYKFFLEKKRLKNIAIAIPIIFIVFTATQFYHLLFLSQTSFVVKRERNKQLAEVLGQIKANKTVFLYNAIEAAIFLRHDNYFQYLKPSDYLEEGDKNILKEPYTDFILIHADEAQQQGFDPKCYRKKEIDQYYLFEKTPDCLKVS